MFRLRREEVVAEAVGLLVELLHVVSQRLPFWMTPFGSQKADRVKKVLIYHLAI